MCGLTGFWRPSGLPGTCEPVLDDMVAAIRSRGPDVKGVWFDRDAGIALGHRRLSILELSEAGAQPMISPSGRFVLVFNGEIYNHLDLRRSLADGRSPPRFRGTSDTETLLAGFDEWGLTRTLARSSGMFALACWDRQQGVLYLARDRMGEKPLYYGWQGEGENRTLLFASELKALIRHPAFEARIDRRSVEGFFTRLCVPGNHSIWEGIAKVAPGTIMRIDGVGEAATENFWSLEATISAGLADRIEDPDRAIDLVHDSLAEAVRRQLISDVPVGAFLSGGVDSSLIVALMQEATGGTARTFSIGFEDDRYNEADHARAVAEHLRTDHHELIVTADHARSVIPDLPRIYDEPFADSSQIPTYLVSQLARSHVTVSLSGDGADELFGGYTRYGKALAAWDRIRKMPSLLRRTGAAAVKTAPSLLPIGILRGASFAEAANVVDFYTRYTDHSLGLMDGEAQERSDRIPAGLSSLEQLMAFDQLGYLPDDILVKVDRAAMAVSLETRAPYLDRDVVATSWRLASGLKQRTENGKMVTKWPLRRLLDRYVPRALIERPKRGFGAPVGEWLRGPLRDWADDLLARDQLDRMDFVDADVASALWSTHRSGRENHAELVWALTMLSAWHREYFSPRDRPCADL